MPSSACGFRWPLRASSSSIFDASSTVSEVRMAAAAGVRLPRSARPCRSSRSLSFLSSRSPDAKRGLSSMSSAIGTAAPKTGTIHQKLVSEARGTHTAPRTRTYRADCQLTLEHPPRLGVEPRVPGARLTETSEDRPYSPDRGSLEAAPRRPGSCSRPPSWARRPGASFLDCSIDRPSPFRT
jgi:hypothetical protein